MIHTSYKCTTFTYFNRHENHCSWGVCAVIKGVQTYFKYHKQKLNMKYIVLYGVDGFQLTEATLFGYSVCCLQKVLKMLGSKQTFLYVCFIS